MKRNLLFLFAATLFVFTSCDKEDEHMHGDDETAYHIHMHSPDESDKTVGETITIKMDVEDHNGGTVHHVNVRVYNKADESEEIFNMPTEAHVHETDGLFEMEETLELNVDPDTEWVLEAKVWGHEAGKGEVTETVEFKVVN
ncbi:MAG: hypothetical protein GYB31_07005 [Bacteroidetes bacterium]|nr:hypothetical protein [Bacteroidota bacterium]